MWYAVDAMIVRSTALHDLDTAALEVSADLVSWSARPGTQVDGLDRAITPWLNQVRPPPVCPHARSPGPAHRSLRTPLRALLYVRRPRGEAVLLLFPAAWESST